jgi:hypothetical protein
MPVAVSETASDASRNSYDSFEKVMLIIDGGGIA